MVMKKIFKWMMNPYSDIDLNLDSDETDWHYATPFEMLQERIDIRGSTKKLEIAHKAIVRIINSMAIRPSNIVFNSDGERKRLLETTKDYQSLADDIRQELFAREIYLEIIETMDLHRLAKNTEILTSVLDNHGVDTIGKLNGE